MGPSAQHEKGRQASPYLNARHDRDRLRIPFSSGYTQVWFSLSCKEHPHGKRSRG